MIAKLRHSMGVIFLFAISIMLTANVSTGSERSMTSSGAARAEGMKINLLVRPKRSYLSHEIQKPLGQLELFNFDATGLGDAEGSEELKKMNKRSRVPGADQYLAIRKFGSRLRRGGGITLGQLEITGPILATINSSGSGHVQVKPLRPIFVARRDEELVAPDPMTTLVDQSDQGANEVENPMTGDYSSRLSLLTMRKAPASSDSRAELENDVLLGQLEDSVPLSSQMLINSRQPLNSAHNKKEQKSLNGQQVEYSADSNYLPRISRGLMR